MMYQRLFNLDYFSLQIFLNLKFLPCFFFQFPKLKFFPAGFVHSALRLVNLHPIKFDQLLPSVEDEGIEQTGVLVGIVAEWVRGYC